MMRKHRRRAWVFQALPDRYDLRTRLRTGLAERWLVTRFGKEMRAWDTVYFWLGGEPILRGLYGWGRIKEPVRGDSIQVRCEKAFPVGIPADVVKRLPQFRNNMLFRMAAGTNFRLSDAEDAALIGSIQTHLGEEMAPPAVGFLIPRAGRAGV